MARVVLENLAKTYPASGKQAAFHAVKGIDLEIRDGEFMVLVGPSGCGKSTTLRMIAGLEEITAGTISIDGKVVNHVLPKDRDIAMVFQNYALYPHMSVYENMAFGLTLRKLPKPEIDQRVQEAAALLGLADLLERKPKALSGGQRQRVAVGRAIVRQPKVFLFDEPLSNLDAKMRVAMRAELSKLHARLRATMIYVTHDQVEAMTMGDRICVMHDGQIMQTAEPLTLYNRPTNLYTAGFIGSPPMNFFRGTIQPSHDGAHLMFVETPSTTTSSSAPPPLTLRLPATLANIARPRTGQPIVLGIRPENIRESIASSSSAPSLASAPVPSPDTNAQVTIEVVEPMGAETFLHLTTGATTFIARVPPTHPHRPGEILNATFDLATAQLFDAGTGAALAIIQ